MSQSQVQPAGTSPRTTDTSHLHELLAEFSTLMLGTFGEVGQTPRLNARPMGVARLDRDCTLYFLTDIGSEKVDEANRAVSHVVGQSKTRFVSMRGRVGVSRDRELIRSLWSKWSEVWFDGPEDPRVTVLIFEPEEAELWDSSGAKGIRFLLDAAKALATGKAPQGQEGETHEKVRVRPG